MKNTEKVLYYCERKWQTRVGLIGLTNFEADQLPMFQDIYKNCQTWRWYKVIEPEKDTAADKTENKNENNENN